MSKFEAAAAPPIKLTYYFLDFVCSSLSSERFGYISNQVYDGVQVEDEVSTLFETSSTSHSQLGNKGECSP